MGGLSAQREMEKVGGYMSSCGRSWYHDGGCLKKEKYRGSDAVYAKDLCGPLLGSVRAVCVTKRGYRIVF